jgi:hypothetical protein
LRSDKKFNKHLNEIEQSLREFLSHQSKLAYPDNGQMRIYLEGRIISKMVGIYCAVFFTEEEGVNHFFDAMKSDYKFYKNQADENKQKLEKSKKSD